ncbi:MAG: hypothetical protein WD317_11405 [Balneolaceae bacterium]
MDYMIDALLVAVLTSVIGSIAFFVLLWMLKPNIGISNQIAHYNGSDDQDIYLFKIINKSWFFCLYNIEVSLSLVRKETVEGGINSRFDPLLIKKNRITQIPNLRSNGDDAFFAQILTSKERLSLLLSSNDRYLELQIMARHALSGFSKVFTKRYHTPSCVVRGKFVHGNDFSIK